MKTLPKLLSKNTIAAGPVIHQSTNPLIPFLAAALLLAGAASALADVHYVDINSTNATPPYTTWATAATNIQDAVYAAVAGDEVVVTNGIYSHVVVPIPLMLRSVNGPQFTTISGGRSPP